jgi:hypothetical protein
LHNCHSAKQKNKNKKVRSQIQKLIHSVFRTCIAYFAAPSVEKATFMATLFVDCKTAKKPESFHHHNHASACIALVLDRPQDPSLAQPVFGVRIQPVKTNFFLKCSDILHFFASLYYNYYSLSMIGSFYWLLSWCPTNYMKFI